jgi:hypothetical protein
MSDSDAREQARATGDAVPVSAPDWVPVWAMPNVTLDDRVETSHAALVTLHDQRLRAIAERRATIDAFLRSFRDEFGVQISPTVAMLRQGAPESVRTVAAFGGLRDAVCVSAIVAGHALTLKWKGPRGVRYSDAFDVYPWFPSPQYDGHIMVATPAVAGMHSAGPLQPQSAPALAERSLTPGELDDVLLRALLAHWEDYFATGNDTIKNRRLFRALEMARAASRMPGGTDATFFDEGRAVALWVSAFEILAYDGRGVDVRRVLSLLGRVQWLTSKLKGKPVQTNLAGTIYKRLYIARSEFLHGNPVTPETLKLAKRQQSVLFFAAPLFRLALTAFLDLHFSETLPDTADDEDRGRHIAKQMAFNQPQRLAEDAILVADDAPDAG